MRKIEMEEKLQNHPEASEELQLNREKNFDLCFKAVVDFGKVAYKVSDGENEFDKAILKADVALALKCLNSFEQKVITLRYGLADNIQRTYQKIGSLCGFCSNYIRFTHNKAIHKLREKTLTDNVLDGILTKKDLDKICKQTRGIAICKQLEGRIK